MRRFELIVEIEECGEDCPNFCVKSGMGHCEDWIQCTETHKEIESWTFKGFPEWCPLKEIKMGDVSIVKNVEEKKFKPITFQIQVDTVEELKQLYCTFNHGLITKALWSVNKDSSLIPRKFLDAFREIEQEYVFIGLNNDFDIFVTSLRKAIKGL